MSDRDGTGCTGKIAYESRRSAKEQARRFQIKHGKRLHVYRCAIAQHWHLSSVAANREQAEAFALRMAERKGLLA